MGIAASAAVASLAEWVDLDGCLLLADDPFAGLELDADCRWRLTDAPGHGVTRRSDREEPAGRAGTAERTPAGPTRRGPRRAAAATGCPPRGGAPSTRCASCGQVRGPVGGQGPSGRCPPARSMAGSPDEGADGDTTGARDAPNARTTCPTRGTAPVTLIMPRFGLPGGGEWRSMDPCIRVPGTPGRGGRGVRPLLPRSEARRLAGAVRRDVVRCQPPALPRVRVRRARGARDRVQPVRDDPASRRSSPR